jgi:RES domain-containing protein
LTRIWRICKRRHVSSAISGIGAEKYGGRWNRKGDRMVYASSSLSLASLELFVHLEPAYVPNDLRAITATVPDSASIEELEAADLPANWRYYPAPSVLQDIGSNWLRKRRSFLLIVPSAVNPEEKNVLLNPLHPQVATLADVASKAFHFDPRMWK